MNIREPGDKQYSSLHKRRPYLGLIYAKGLLFHCMTMVLHDNYSLTYNQPK